MVFETSVEQIQQLIDKIDPVKYARTRNHINGSVTYLSPYLSRGVITPLQVLTHLIQRGIPYSSMEKLIQELCWREYFQRVLQHRTELDQHSIRQEPAFVTQHLMSKSIIHGDTGIIGIDQAIRKLYQTGYMHNHCRMYVASLACNWARSHWQLPARWMYYHLLDADAASNFCSWQWICGAFSHKKYYANQENVNKYTNTEQKNTFLDVDYDQMESSPVPDELIDYTGPVFNTVLPQHPPIEIDKHLPVILYHPYNLDPAWKKHIKANRVLILEPSHFKRFPVSEKTIDFILKLSKNIDGIQIFSGELDALKTMAPATTYFSKEHPLFAYRDVVIEQREWICEEINGFYPSFSAFWKKCERIIRQQCKQ